MIDHHEQFVRAASGGLIPRLDFIPSVFCDVGDSFHGNDPTAIRRIPVIEVRSDSRGRPAAGRERGGEYYVGSQRDPASGEL